MTATYEDLALRCWSARCGLGVAELLDEIGAGSGDAGSDGPDRAAADLGRLPIGEPEDLGKHEGDPAAGRKAPKLSLTATPDPMGGFNLRVKLANFRLTPEHTGGKPVPGEGHLHLNVDGKKLTRMYGPWFYLDGLASGAHALRVDAVANNHAPYHRDGNPIFATAAVQVT